MAKFMVGRKRRQGIKRQPDGRTHPDSRADRGIDPKVIAARQPHRQGIPIDVVHDPAAESNFGKLFLQKHISQVQYQAGLNWRMIVQRYRAVISAPRPDAVSMSGVIVGPWGGSGEIDKAEALDRRKKYNEAFEALHSGAGHRGCVAVNHWAIGDRGDYALRYLICGLNALALHFKLTKGRN
jgi:hypothetical protein